MKREGAAINVERLFPFVLRSRNLLVGREVLRRSKRKLQFVLITTDLSEKSRAEILADFVDYPVIKRYTSDQLETFFKIRGAKVIGFAKSGLAKSLYAGLKEHRINRPASTGARVVAEPTASEPGDSATRRASQPPPKA